MNPLIYIPGQVVRKRETLLAIGLGSMLDSHVSACWNDVFEHGPDGQAGQIVFFDCPHAPHTSSPRGLNLETQEWREAAKCGDLARGRYWIGWDKKNPPSPEDLIRSKTVPSESVPLLDGEEWEIAVASFVPHRRGIDMETGEEIRVPQAQFATYADECKVWEAFFMDFGQTAGDLVGRVLNLKGGFKFCVDSLAINYRVNSDLIDGLQLIGDTEVFRIIVAAIGVGLRAGIEDQKKTA